MSNESTVGVIGGADGPTNILVSGGFPISLIIVVLVVVIVIAVLWHKNR